MDIAGTGGTGHPKRSRGQRKSAQSLRKGRNHAFARPSGAVFRTLGVPLDYVQEIMRASQARRSKVDLSDSTFEALVEEGKQAKQLYFLQEFRPLRSFRLHVEVEPSDFLLLVGLPGRGTTA